VKGIGARRFEKLKPELTVTPVAAKAAPARNEARSQTVAAKADAKAQK